MKKIIIVAFILILSNLGYSQRNYTLNDDQNFIDSLTKLIKTTKSDSARCLYYFKLASLQLKNKNIELARVYLKKANTLASRSEFLSDVSHYYNTQILLYKDNTKEHEKQLLIANDKLKKYSNKTAYSLRANILKAVVSLKQMKENDKEAFRMIISEAIPIARKSDNFEVLGSLNKSLGIICMNNSNREKADYYLNLAIKWTEREKKSSFTLQESKLDAYIIHAENAIEMKKFSDAKISLDKAYSILKNYPESNINGLFYYSEGLYYFELNQYKEAINCFDKGIKNCIQHKDSPALTRLIFMKCLSLNKLKKYEIARDLLMELCEKENLYMADKKDIFKEIIKTCEDIGDVKNGYTYSLKYISITDSMYDANSKKEIAELEAKYNTAEKEKQISQLEAQKQKAMLISENSKLYNGLFALFSFVLILIVVFLWKHSNSQKKLAFEKEKNYQNSLTTLKNQKEIEVMQAALSGEEIERKRIARDLHDGIGSMLSSLKMRLMKTQSNDFIDRKEIENISVILNNSITELRHVAYNLVPEALLKLGLEHALSDLCHALKTDTTTIHFQANEINKTISQSNQITIYRIVQELLNNALKHARCSEILVDCSQNKNLFYVTVEDNGIGFDLNKSHTFVGLGLKNLKNRVDLLNGKMEIESSPNGGIVFNIELII
jgi:two-component system, NarL family, sensor kinase